MIPASQDDVARAIQRAYAEVPTAFGVGIALDARCAYCPHTAGQHYLQDPPGNGPLKTRCAEACVCSGFCDATAEVYLGSRNAPVRTYTGKPWPGTWEVVGPGRVRWVVPAPSEGIPL